MLVFQPQANANPAVIPYPITPRLSSAQKDTSKNRCQWRIAVIDRLAYAGPAFQIERRALKFLLWLRFPHRRVGLNHMRRNAPEFVPIAAGFDGLFREANRLARGHSYSVVDSDHGNPSRTCRGISVCHHDICTLLPSAARLLEIGRRKVWLQGFRDNAFPFRFS